MKHAQEFVGQACRSSQTAAKALSTNGDQKPRQRLPSRLVDQLFVRLGSIYGHRFGSLFASEQTLESARAEWSVELAGVSPMQIAEALRICRREHDWPPTLPEFARLCRPARIDHPAHRPFVRLPRPAPNKEVAANAIAIMREVLQS